MKPETGITDERELLSACKSGDQQAFRKLYDEFHRQALHVAIRLTGNVQEAEDITQEVFLKVYHEIPRFKMASGLGTWLYRITVNLCLDKTRKIRRRAKYHANPGSLLENDEPASRDNSNHAETELWGEELQRALQAALMELQPKWRTVLVLKDLDGLSYSEIAAIAGCSEGTVCSRLNRGRKALRAILQHAGIDKDYFRD